MANHAGHDDEHDEAHDHDEHDKHDYDATLESEFDTEGTNRLGSKTNDDIDYTAALVADDDRDATGTGTAAIAVTARTAHNRYPLPFGSLAAAVLQDGERIAGGSLREAVGPRNGHQYRTPVDPRVLEEGDELSIELETPPQVARHEGYETAFLETETVTLALK